MAYSKLQDRAAQLKHNYGLTLEAYDAMLVGQRGVCAICGEAPKPGKYLQVDHCHATGKVRGLLCARCNIGLGHVERAGWLPLAFSYLTPRPGLG